MKIALAHWTRRMIGGAEAYIDALIPALLERGMAVGLWHETDAAPGERAIAAGRQIPTWSATRVGVPAALAALNEWRPAVILVNVVHELRTEAALVALAPSVLFAHTYHGTCVSGTKTLTRPDMRPCGHRFGPACLLRYFPRGCGPRTLKTLARDYPANARRVEVARGYRAMVSSSEHMRTEYARQGFPADRLCRIPFFVPPPADLVTAARAPLPRPRGSPLRILFLGRLEGLKGVHVLLRALPHVAASLELPLEVTVAGEGPARGELESLASTVRSAHALIRISFTGWVDGAVKEELLAGSDLLVVPSLWPEPFGMVGVEAGRHGVPAAAFAVGGIPEWLVDGTSGHLAPADPPTVEGLAEAILRCLRDPEHHASLRVGAIRESRRFSREEHVSGLLELFRRLA